MCFSLFSSTAVQVSAHGAADMLFTVKGEPVQDGKITFTVSLCGGIEGFGGAVVLVEYDNTVLSPVNFAPAYKNTGVQKFNGIYSHGIQVGSDNIYSVGYTNTVPEKVSENTDFFNITFEVIGEERNATSVTFYCKEFYSVKNADQSITVGDGLQRIADLTGIATLEAPKPLSATLFTNGITFKWKESIGAAEYEIIRKTAAGTWENCGRVSADNTEYQDFNLESGNTYVYSVIAINESSGTSGFDSMGVSCKYVSKPTNVTAQNGIDGVEVSWDKAKGSDKYQIVRREPGEEEWTVIEEVSNSLTTYKDINVENGKTYEYDINSVLGSFITDTASEGKVITYLKSPSGISVTNMSNGVELKWDIVENTAYYIIYRKVVGIESEFSPYATVTSNTFTDEGVEVRGAYTYSVQAISNLGDESAFTKIGYTIVRVPSTIVKELVPQADSIKVTWEAVDDVDGYNVYRKTENSDWEKAGGASKLSTTFEDTEAKSGEEYFYCVVPCVGGFESAKIPSFQSVYFIEAPKNVTAVNIKNAIKVSWSASEGVIEYRVYRNNGTDEELVGIVDSDKTEFIDYNANTDSVYYYYVIAAGTKDESLSSNKTASVKRIDCVEQINAEVQYDGILVTWKEHAFADSYIVCRLNNGAWTRIAETTELEYIDTTVESGETYGYSVIPVVDEFEGGIDEESITELKYLESTSITDKELTSDGIKIHWKKVTGSKSYEIHRAPLDSDGKLSGNYSKIATVSEDTSSYTDKKVKAGKGYAYSVYVLDEDTRSLPSAECKAVFLATQYIKSLSNAYGGVKITWKSSSGAKNYRIYRKVSDGEWTFIKKVSGSQNSYIDKDAENGVKTYYAVKAQNGDSISTYKGKSFTYFASPVVTVANNTSAITVNWDKIGGAKSYYVYRKAPGEKSWKKVSTVTKNIYTDRDVKNGKIYTYTVKAYNGDIFSAYKSDGWKIKRLPAPKLKSIKNSTSGVTITWDKATGASKYIVMRKANGTSKWEEIKTTTSLSFTDKTAKQGKIYTYTVKAGYGDYRSTYTASGLKMKRLARPALSSVKSAKNGITFTWKEVTGASGYFVYRKTGSGDWEQIAKVTGTETLYYVDKTAKKGKTYYYSVRAYSGSYKSAYNTTGLKIKDKY